MATLINHEILDLSFYPAVNMEYECPFQYMSGIYGGVAGKRCITLVNITDLRRIFNGSFVDSAQLYCKLAYKNGRAILNALDDEWRRMEKIKVPPYHLSEESVYLIREVSQPLKNIFVLECENSPNKYCCMMKRLSSRARDAKYEERDCCAQKFGSCAEQRNSFATLVKILKLLDFCVNYNTLLPFLHFLPLKNSNGANNPARDIVDNYRCEEDKCKFFACIHDEYEDCLEIRVPLCQRNPSNRNECRQYSYYQLREREFPYGKPCEERDYGETCTCPCADLPWSSWSTSTKPCGNYTAYRFRPKARHEYEKVDCLKSPELCCFEQEERYFPPCPSNKVNKIICKNNGGEVEEIGSKLQCICKEPFRSGELCENGFKSCDEKKGCQNGGTCLQYGNYGVCSCGAALTGNQCEFVIGACTSQSCLNGGNCSTVDSNSYTCICAPGFEGAHCETDNASQTKMGMAIIFCTRVHSPEASDKQRQSFIKEILEIRQRCRRNVVSKSHDRHPVEGEDDSHVYVEHCHQLRHIHLYSKALRHLTADVGLIQVRDEHFRTTTAGSRIKITFRHPVEGEDCSHVYVEHCHQLRHIHLYSKALRHLTADVGLIQVRDEHFRTTTAGSRCQFTCPYEGSKLHFDTLSKVKIVRMFTLNIVT
ncbi:Sushi, nidogen and EGF-like domain-containing protein 1 [Trichinella patagoniensis]|uniref:Sushi, nidogen and EGF-like domain-containing protein 1 n=1 Tax=Trichinella patagoniensis TaxID=990121 RepID=A0A0V0ZPT4_9BILA|nr:Sushi, nidogen and EGF-like domain-containing protein 1 [Trichinella patagoniensis]